MTAVGARTDGTVGGAQRARSRDGTGSPPRGQRRHTSHVARKDGHSYSPLRPLCRGMLAVLTIWSWPVGSAWNPMLEIPTRMPATDLILIFR